MNKKKRQKAFVSVLSSFFSENKIFVLESVSLEKPRTKGVLEIMNGLGLEGKTLFVLDSADKNFILSCRNIPNALSTSVESMNIYDLLNNDNLVLTAGALKKLEEKLG